MKLFVRMFMKHIFPNIKLEALKGVGCTLLRCWMIYVLNNVDIHKNHCFLRKFENVIFNIFRRILDPENKKQFNRLVGEEYATVYESWWKENIAPIWEDINNNFREQTFFKKNYDKEFNADFNRESGKSEDFCKQNGNFWIELYWRKLYNK